jgi:2-dehydro-3-deoxyphosphogluconate aldolase/(4S)-4-hydroxy-2-oxoglutarate aldolase
MSAPADTNPLLERMTRAGVVPVVVLEDARDAVPVAEAIAAGGCPLIEITLRTPAALPAIQALASHPDVMVGAGTVLNGDQARAAQAAGARFIVAPGLDAGTVAVARALGLPVLPGVATATEVQAAYNLGLRLVKYFPAGLLGGPPALRALAEVFRDMRFMPTGGVREADLREYLGMPSVVACGGSWLAPPELISAGDYAGIERRVATAVSIARSVRAHGTSTV